MKKLYVLLLLVASIQISFGQWILQPKVTTADLYQVRFVDRNTGWALGQFWTKDGINLVPANKSSIVRTTDGGNSWTEQVLNNSLLRGLSMVNRSIGWAVGTTAGGNGLILKTTDGGGSWFLVDSSATRSRLYTIYSLDTLHSWIGGWNDTTTFILRTTNGGVSWQGVYDKSLDVNEIFFWDETYGWIVGEGGTIARTMDGGTTWIKVFQATDGRGLLSPLRRIRFADWLHGCAVGGIAGVETKVWTSDGGLTWNVVNATGAGSSLHGLWLTDANNSWCVGGANAGLTIQKTANGGRTWVKQQFPPSVVPTVSYFEDVTFVSPIEGWIVGDAGCILKTTNGGDPTATFAPHQVDGAALTFRLSQNYPNPFNPSTTISFNLKSESFVSLKIFDALGREVALLASEILPAGEHARQWNAAGFPSGVYYYRLQARPNDGQPAVGLADGQAGSFHETKRLILLR